MLLSQDDHTGIIWKSEKVGMAKNKGFCVSTATEPLDCECKVISASSWKQNRFVLVQFFFFTEHIFHKLFGDPPYILSTPRNSRKMALGRRDSSY